MTARRYLTLAGAVAGVSVLAGCSTEELVAFNAGLEMYNGVTYYDTNDEPMTLSCRSGNGYLIAHGGVRNNQQYTYVINRAPIDVEVSVKDQAGGGTTLYTSRGQTSETYWTYPSYDLEYSWAC